MTLDEMQSLFNEGDILVRAAERGEIGRVPSDISYLRTCFKWHFQVRRYVKVYGRKLRKGFLLSLPMLVIDLLWIRSHDSRILRGVLEDSFSYSTVGYSSSRGPSGFEELLLTGFTIATAVLFLLPIGVAIARYWTHQKAKAYLAEIEDFSIQKTKQFSP